ncbi:MAG: mevalonate kinase [Cyanobacteria bacterium REEB65]|nr:mevalonate kinase [Cyanobacteria bacterium REEB65]
MTTAAAHAKVIVTGEHAVVYGFGAVSVPVRSLACEVSIDPSPDGLTTFLADAFPGRYLAGAAQDHPLAFLEELLAWLLTEELPKWGVLLEQRPPLTISVRSQIPIGSGLGSSAAILVAATRGLFAHFGVHPPDREIQRLAHAAEMGVHGRSSGLDVATAVSDAPLYYTTGCPARVLNVGTPFHLLVSLSGLPSFTRKVVLDIRQQRERQPERIAAVFAEIGALSRQAAVAIEQGDLAALGDLMNRNHSLLTQLGVSCPELDRLVHAGNAAGALGSKLTGAGRGGCALALVDAGRLEAVRQALLDAGATDVYDLAVASRSVPAGAPSLQTAAP